MPDAIATDPTEYFDEHNQLHPHQIRVILGQPTLLARIHLLPGHYVIHAKGVVSLDRFIEGPATTAMLGLQKGSPILGRADDIGEASLVPGRDESRPLGSVATIALLLAVRVQRETDYVLWAATTNGISIFVSNYQLVAMEMHRVWYGSTPYFGPAVAFPELLSRIFRP